MADEYKNVRRIQATTRSNLSTELKTKMIGFDSTTKALGFKNSAGVMSWYNPEGGNASFNSLVLSGFLGAVGNLSINSDGEVIVTNDEIAADITASTGAIQFVDGITINTDTTKFNVGAIACYFSDLTNPLTPITVLKQFEAQTAIALVSMAGHVTYIAIDVDGTIVQQGSPFLPEQCRDLVPLGIVVHSNHTVINAINNAVHVSLSPANQLSDFMDSLGQFNIRGNVFSCNSLLKLNKTSGEIFKNGANFVTNPEDPHTVFLDVLTAPATLRYRTQTGTETTDSNSVIPNKWDNAGTATTISGTKFTIQHINIFQSNLVRLQYGQTLYSTMAEAKAALSTDPFVVEDNIGTNGLLRGLLIVSSNATDLSDPAQAFFYEVNKFGSVVPLGGGTGEVVSLQTAYNNSVTPEIILNNSIGTITIDKGASTLTTLLELVGNSTTYMSFTTTGIDLALTGRITKNSYRFFNEYHGTESVFYSYDEATRVFTFNSGGTSIYYIDGVRYTAPSNLTVTHTTDFTVHYIYINASNALVTSTTPWDLKTDVPLFAVYYSTSGISIPIFECHNKTRDIDWHGNAHTTLGTQAEVEGFALIGLNLDVAIPTYAQLQYGISTGWLKDEDIKIGLDQFTGQGANTYSFLFRNTAGSSDLMVIPNWSQPFFVGTYIQYDNPNGGSRIDLAANKWVNYFVVAIPAKSSNTGAIVTTTNHKYRFVLVAGQKQHDNLASAQAEEFWSLNLGDLNNFPEWVPLYRITYKTNASLSTIGKCYVDDYKRYYVARASITGASSTSTIHNSLTGRDTADAHPHTAISVTGENRILFVDNGALSTKAGFEYDPVTETLSIASSSSSSEVLKITRNSIEIPASNTNSLYIKAARTIYLNFDSDNNPVEECGLIFRTGQEPSHYTELYKLGNSVTIGTETKFESTILAYNRATYQYNYFTRLLETTTSNPTDPYTTKGARQGDIWYDSTNKWVALMLGNASNERVYLSTVGSQPITAITGTPYGVAFFDASGNGASSSLFNYRVDGRFGVGSLDPEGLVEFECSTASYPQLVLTDNRTHATDTGAELAFIGKNGAGSKYGMGAIRCGAIVTQTDQSYIAMSVYGQTGEQDIARFYPTGMSLLSTNVGSTPPELRLYNNANTFYTAFRSAGVSSSKTFTLPNGYGTNGQVLKTDGAGELSWVDKNPVLTKTIIIENPTSTDEFTIFKVDTATNVTVQEVIAVITGAGTSCDYVLKHGADRSLGSNWASSTASSKIGGTVATISSSTLSADEWVWIDVGVVVGVITSIAVDIRYTEN